MTNVYFYTNFKLKMIIVGIINENCKTFKGE